MYEQKHKKHYFVRTSNGEWISNDHAIFADRLGILRSRKLAQRFQMPLSIHECGDGTFWIYKHEWHAIEAKMEKTTECRNQRNALIKEQLEKCRKINDSIEEYLTLLKEKKQ